MTLQIIGHSAVYALRVGVAGYDLSRIDDVDLSEHNSSPFNQLLIRTRIALAVYGVSVPSAAVREFPIHIVPSRVADVEVNVSLSLVK